MDDHTRDARIRHHERATTNNQQELQRSLFLSSEAQTTSTLYILLSFDHDTLKSA
jgi:hypothetical protein